MKSTVWSLVGVVGVMAGLAADAQGQGPRGYGQNGFYYSGTYGQFYPPIYNGPRESTGGFSSTAPGRSQYQYNTPRYGTGAILQTNQFNYIPNGGGYGYPGYGYGGYGGYGYNYQGYGGSPAYGYGSGFRSRSNYRYGW